MWSASLKSIDFLVKYNTVEAFCRGALRELDKLVRDRGEINFAGFY